MVYKKVLLQDEAIITNAEIAAAAAIAKSKISATGTWAVAEIPNLPASIITSGLLANARGGLNKVLLPTWTNDFTLVYKSGTDQFEMQALGAPAAHNILSAEHADTLLAAVVAGDIIIGDATPKWSRLAKGTQNYLLTMGASLPAWTAFSDTIHGSRGTGLHGDVVGGASGALTVTQHGALAAITNAHAWADINKATSSIANITTRDHDLLAGLSDDDHTLYLLINGTRAMTGALRLALLAADPTLVDGMLFARSDLDALYFVYDAGAGAVKKQVMVEGLASAEGVWFGNGFLDTISPVEMTGAGDGTFTKKSTWGKITSGAALNNKHSGYSEWGFDTNADYATYDKYPQFEINLRFTSVAAMNYWVQWGGSGNVPEDATKKKFGIKVINGALYTFSGDGTTESTLDLSTALIAATWYRIRVKRVASGTTVWVDGVEKTTKTTNVPSGVSDIDSTIQIVLKTTEAVDKGAYFRPIKAVHAQ